MKSLAVIPARGGSTRLKDKNVHPLGGKPLIRWTVEAVVKSRSFDTIIVSTDSDEIFDAVFLNSYFRYFFSDEWIGPNVDLLIILFFKLYSIYYVICF